MTSNIEGVIFDWVETLSHGKRTLFPFSEKVLRTLKSKYKLGLVSLAGHGNADRWNDLKVTGVLPYFDSVVVDTTKKSQHYLDCMNIMGTLPRNTAIVDDRTLRGIQIGNELGCVTFWVQKGPYAHELPTPKTGEPTYRIDTVEDLLRYL